LKIEISLGFGSAIYQGFSASQIKDAFDLYGIEKHRFSDTMVRLRVMESKALSLLNQKVKNK
jgi:hypothetical protein